jgi:hypothetical protein
MLASSTTAFVKAPSFAMFYFRVSLEPIPTPPPLRVPFHVRDQNLTIIFAITTANIRPKARFGDEKIGAAGLILGNTAVVMIM